MIRCGLPRRRGRRGGPRAPRRTRGPRSASTSLNPRDRHLTREHVPLADVLAGQVTCSSPATSRRDSPRLQPRRSRSRHRAACRGTRARPSWRGCGGGAARRGGSLDGLGGPAERRRRRRASRGLAPPIGGGKGGSRVLLGVPVGLGRLANGVIPPFFNRAVRGRGVKDMRRPPFRAAGTITMNRDIPPAKEPRGRLRAVPGRLGRGSHRRLRVGLRAGGRGRPGRRSPAAEPVHRCRRP